MNIVIIGSSGLIGTKLTKILRDRGHDVVATTRASGVDVLTGAGLVEAFRGAQVVVDVTNSPSFEPAAVLKFFTTSTPNLLRAELAAGVAHHVALSVVGAERLPDSGYMVAKVAQESLIQSGNVPYTIVRATQFFEFLGAIAESGVETQPGASGIRLPSYLIQPMAADDVATLLADAAVAPPVNGMIEIAGPDALPMDEFVRRYLAATGDKRTVVGDPNALYFGARINDASITPGKNPRLGKTHLEQWVGARKTG